MMNRIYPVVTLAALTLAVGYFQPSRSAVAQSPCCNTCPRCNACCELKAEKVDLEKKCWTVERQQICIPRVVFPWQKSCGNPCANNGAYVKTIKVLKSHTYTCPACEYSWTPVSHGCAPCRAAGDFITVPLGESSVSEERIPDRHSPAASAH